MKKQDNKLIAYCSLYCPKCYKMSVSDAAMNLKKELENKHICGKTKWLSKSFYSELDSLISLHCNKFCKEGGGSPNCKIRICCIKKGYNGCWECNNFKSCDKLSNQFIENIKLMNSKKKRKKKEV